MSAPSKNIRVVVRVRPPNTRELEQNQRTIIKCDTQQQLIFDPDEEEDEFFFHGAKQYHRDITRKQNKKLPMEFDEIFDDTSANVDVFEAAMRPLVQSVMDGFNCSAFVYGATGAGKTHTMLGNEQQPGITYLTMRHLFDQMDELSAERRFDIGISYLEVYNEQVMNLLAIGSGPLKLREAADKVVVSGLDLKMIRSAEELLDLLAQGNRNRTQHPTDANAESSRSHAIFQVHIRMANRSSGTKNTVKLSMIDLAGSERAASTKGVGVRFKEGASINKSLLALGNCINRLADGAKHIPYRDSNLTRIIKDSLGGNCRTVMIANVSPSSLTYEDTYNTLKYASRAKKIQSTAKLNVCKNNTPKEVLVKQLSDQHSELLALREKVRVLEERLARAERSPKTVVVQPQQPVASETAAAPAVAVRVGLSGSDVRALLQPWYDRIDTIYLAMRDLMQTSLRIDSKDKIFLFRLEVKQYADTAMQELVLDGNSVKADLAYISATVDRSRPIDSQEQIKKYRERVQEKKLELKRLKREINDFEFADQLHHYLAGKEHEFNSVKHHYKNRHVLEINRIYHSELQHLLSMLKLSNHIIQDDYYLLRSHDMIDINMRENLEQLKRLGRGRRDAPGVAAEEIPSYEAVHGLCTTPQAASRPASRAIDSSVAAAHPTITVTAADGGGDALRHDSDIDAMDRFNITLAEHGVERTPGDDEFEDVDDDDDDDAAAAGEADARPLDATVSLAVPTLNMRRRSRSLTGGAKSSDPADREPPSKKPAKKLFKADSFNVRKAVLTNNAAQSFAPSKASVSAASVSSSSGMVVHHHVPLPPRASVHVTTVAALRAQMKQQSAGGAHQRSGSAGSDAERMEVDARSAAFDALSAKAGQVKSKTNMLRSILKDTSGANVLYKNVPKVTSKTLVPATKSLVDLKHKRSPGRVSPRSKVLPRQNNASRARQRMLTGTPATAAATTNATAATTTTTTTTAADVALKNKFKLIPSK